MVTNLVKLVLRNDLSVKENVEWMEPIPIEVNGSGGW